jgi:hypothetical protein
VAGARFKAVAAALCGALMLAACNTKGTLDRTQVETVRVEGRRYEVRIASTPVEGEWRIFIVRATLVVNPDAEVELSRAVNVAQPFMERTCRGAYTVLEQNLADEVNFFARFRCAP